MFVSQDPTTKTALRAAQPAIPSTSAARADQDDLRLYAAVIQQSSEAVIITDADLDAPGPRIVFVNPAFCAMTGYSKEELIGQNPRILQGPATNQAVLGQLRAALDQGKPFVGANTNYCKNGTPYHVEWRITPIYDDGGKLRYFASNQRDVTARDAAEQELRASEARFRDLATNSPDFIYIIDIGERTPVYFSRTTFLGYTTAEMSESSFMMQVTHTDDVAPAFASWQRVVASPPGSTTMIEYRLHSKAGQWEWVESRGTVLSASAEGKPLQVLMTLRIITERKQLEAQFLQAQKMESIGRLAGGVAHDFNNLLTAILGYTDILLDAAKPDSDTYADVSEIQRAAQRATTLTRQLTAFARRQQIELHPLSVNALILDMTNLIRRVIGEDIELVLVPTAEPAVMQADAGRIEQVILNLAVNARDAMPRGGKLTIRIEYLTGSAQPMIDLAVGPYIDIQISDTGIGMDEQTQQHLFEPFFTTKAPGAGTGLGLATCYGIVRQHNGHIWASSQLGIGTTFHIVLPILDHHAKIKPSEPARSSIIGGTERILLVEDEPAVRLLAARILQKLGYTVLEASDGLEALAVFNTAAANVDLLLTDVVMPQMGGLALVEELQKKAGSQRVLLMSGYTETNMTVADNTARLHFLQKPFTPQTLAQAVRSALDHQPLLMQAV
ncbi:MAG: PAS domain S-box protein [Roseiflexaceae bacterium]|nr:PAS domain S-box protein [Roseiflexaceae bacterium]